MDSSLAAADHREVCTISKYQEFDAQIFEATKIMIGFTLSEGQKAELLKIAREIETACQDGSLSGDERQQLLETMMVCEAKGHLWKETADPENGTSTLSCRRCGAEEHLQW